jgi:hypothetical protein
MRRFMVLVTVLGLVGAAFVFPVVGAGAGGPAARTATIKKVALNAPPGTKFTVQLTCQEPEIFVPGGGGTTTDELDFTFTVNAAGEAVPDGTNTVEFDGNADVCTVTETAAGGAAATSYECADNHLLLDQTTVEPGGLDDPAVDPAAPAPLPFCLSNGPQAEPIQFHGGERSQEVVVTVTNTFPVAAAAAVETVINFTG